MTDQKYTPGPWHVTEAEIPSGEIMVLGGEGFDFGCIASVTEMLDAHLIAAAPELLEMLKRYRNETPIGNQPHMIAEEADALIAKAEGQP